MPTKREYRDRYYLLFGLVIGGSFSFLGSFVAGSYFTIFTEPDLLFFIATFGGFVFLFAAAYITLWNISKKMK